MVTNQQNRNYNILVLFFVYFFLFSSFLFYLFIFYLFIFLLFTLHGHDCDSSAGLLFPSLICYYVYQLRFFPSLSSIPHVLVNYWLFSLKVSFNSCLVVTLHYIRPNPPPQRESISPLLSLSNAWLHVTSSLIKMSLSYSTPLLTSLFGNQYGSTAFFRTIPALA